MSIIDQFIAQYNKQFDFYHKLSQIVAIKIEDELTKRGIKAIVSFRAKRPDRLRDKISKRDLNKNYESVDQMFNDIVDLSGVRIALYFPSEKTVIGEIVEELFFIEEIKTFPDKTQSPKYEKKFSGYWANHYRVQLKPDGVNQRYANVTVEIQVASVLMHAWSEVEHDLVYKPLSGKLSEEELSILDEINGLVMAGEIALERLQSAMAERTRATSNLSDKYEFANFLLNSLNKNFKNKIKVGNNYKLNSFFNNSNNNIPASAFESLIKQINIASKETATDQLIDMLFSNLEKEDLNNISEYFRQFNFSVKEISLFEKFVKKWILLEQLLRELYSQLNVDSQRRSITDITPLLKHNILSKEDQIQFREIRGIRNSLLHGVDIPPDSFIHEAQESLSVLCKKLIDQLTDEKARDFFNGELKKYS